MDIRIAGIEIGCDYIVWVEALGNWSGACVVMHGVRLASAFAGSVCTTKSMRIFRRICSGDSTVRPSVAAYTLFDDHIGYELVVEADTYGYWSCPGR